MKVKFQDKSGSIQVTRLVKYASTLDTEIDVGKKIKLSKSVVKKSDTK